MDCLRCVINDHAQGKRCTDAISTSPNKPSFIDAGACYNSGIVYLSIVIPSRTHHPTRHLPDHLRLLRSYSPQIQSENGPQESVYMVFEEIRVNLTLSSRDFGHCWRSRICYSNIVARLKREHALRFTCVIES